MTAPRAESPFGVVTMSVHKLTAGSGYDYLTRQVAALDATEKGHTGLASYYIERGESPGVWIGSGMNGIDGLGVGDPVTAEQMRALFGCGLHPLAELRQQQLEGPDLTDQDFQSVARLGSPFRIVDNDLIPFRLEVARRIAALNTAIGKPADASIAAADRARVRTQVAREFFLAEHGREPIDARELAGQIAKDSRPRTQTVAGYDLTFSPVKSVSALWAIVDPPVAAVIERAHQAAVKDALAFIERHALFTRTGTQGHPAGQRPRPGRDRVHPPGQPSRRPGPTHARCCGKQGADPRRTLAVHRRPAAVQGQRGRLGDLQHHARAASPRHVRRAVRRATRQRPGQAADPGDRRCRPATEPALVDPARPHQHPPRRARHPIPRRSWPTTDTGRSVASAQQATLETRDAKHEPRSLTEQRATWLSEAAAVLGERGAVAAMVQTALTPAAETATVADARWVAQTADHILAVMEESRSTWQMWHVRAEAQRQVRTIDLPAERAAALVDLLVDEVLDRRCVALAAPADNIEEPRALRRVDGSSVYTVAGAELYTSQRILDAERRLVIAAGRRDGSAVDESAVDLALLEMAANRTALDLGQASLVRQMCTSGARLQLAIAPAGAGKTRACQMLCVRA